MLVNEKKYYKIYAMSNISIILGSAKMIIVCFFNIFNKLSRIGCKNRYKSHLEDRKNMHIKMCIDAHFYVHLHKNDINTDLSEPILAKTWESAIRASLPAPVKPEPLVGVSSYMFFNDPCKKGRIVLYISCLVSRSSQFYGFFNQDMVPAVFMFYSKDGYDRGLCS
jgi:hypothetical protein